MTYLEIIEWIESHSVNVIDNGFGIEYKNSDGELVTLYGSGLIDCVNAASKLTY
jgi:hypothetical protein